MFLPSQLLGKIKSCFYQFSTKLEGLTEEVAASLGDRAGAVPLACRPCIASDGNVFESVNLVLDSFEK